MFLISLLLSANLWHVHGSLAWSFMDWPIEPMLTEWELEGCLSLLPDNDNFSASAMLPTGTDTYDPESYEVCSHWVSTLNDSALSVKAFHAADALRSRFAWVRHSWYCILMVWMP